MKSIAQERGTVMFPEFTGERVYMRRFEKGVLPFDLARWQPTVDAMLEGITTDMPMYLMVDQGLVKAGNTQRRPGMHIDGYWIEGCGHRTHRGVSTHSGSSQHRGTGGSPFHGGRGRDSNAHRGDPHSGNAHRGNGSRHMANRGDDAWPADATYEEHEGILLASDIIGCRALIGEFNGAPGQGGDCSHIKTDHMHELIMLPHTTYAGNVTMLHESLPVAHECLRTLVRINVPGWSPQ